MPNHPLKYGIVRQDTPFTQQSLNPIFEDILRASINILVMNRLINSINERYIPFLFACLLEIPPILVFINQIRAQPLVMLFSRFRFIYGDFKIISISCIYDVPFDFSIHNTQHCTNTFIPVRPISRPIIVAFFAIEQEIPQTVKDRLSLICLPSLRAMRMSANDTIRTIIDEITVPFYRFR